MAAQLLARSAWTDTPAASPALLDPARVVGLAVHWLGPAAPAAVVEAVDVDAVARYLRGVRRFHLSKGWSDIAYQEAVDQVGRRWTLRGWTRQSAANGDVEPNQRFGAVLALIGQGQQPTPQLLAGLADARRAFRRHYPHATALRTHNQVRPEPTACPGPDLTSWVLAGGPAPGEDDEMTTDEMIRALTAELRNADGHLTKQLRRHVRECVQIELGEQAAGDNPPT